jgi:predicted dehydrogenase/aryl-alcohol dehydrogenase-like predicted oxidoreductase
MTILQWGIIGPGSIAHNFADGLAQSTSGRLVAIASRDADRRTKFGDRYAVPQDQRHATPEALLADPAVQAVYIATPHPWHAQLSIRALRAGKAVLVEKPAGLNAAEVTAVTEVAAQQGRFWAEGFMYRYHPQIARVLEIIASGEIGKVTHVETRFGFAAGFNATSRLYDLSLAGGGILDVGGYPVSLARLIAGEEPVTVRGGGVLAPTGVDAVAYAVLTFPGGMTAEIACAVARNMDNRAHVHGDKGRIVIDDPWVPGRNAGPSTTQIHITAGGQTRSETHGDHRMLFAFEAEAVSRAILDGASGVPAPGVSPAGSIGNATVLDRWRAEVGYQTAVERDVPAVLHHVLPRGLPPMPMARIPGMDRDISQLILGCDNRNTVAEGAIIWDAFAEAGGTAFDTGFVYGGGLHEQVLGRWLAARGVADQMTVIVKGAHSPYCLPDVIGAQLDISLGRLGIARAPVYIMHRDNPDVPVGEFVDALNAAVAAGKIGTFGGSNWAPDRIAAANAYAAAHDLQGFTILNNNLSLAVMEQPVWAGCVTSNSPATLDFLREGKVAHLSWSSQARGYFLPEPLRNRLPPDTAPETCFGSPANAQRRARAEELAARHGLSAHNVATAWVLSQPFASFALIGPRSPGELASTMPGAALHLTAAEVAWLNLED